MTPVPFDLITFSSFIIYAAMMFFTGSWLSRNEDNTFHNLSLLFIVLPFLAGYIGTSNNSYLAGAITSGMTSLALTTLLGNLSLKTCLILAVISPITFCFSIWLLRSF